MALIVAGVVAVVLTPVAAVIARRTGIVDHPGPLKVQSRPVPYLGGLAVLAGLAVPLAPTRPALLVPLGLAAALGLADDLTHLAPPVRLVVEVLVGIATAWAAPAADLPGAALTVVVVVALVNAVNLLDGLDGLAAGVAATGALGFAVTLGGDGRVLALALAGALAGFLVWNRPPARIYLGDAGSYLVGTALAVLVTDAFARAESLAVAAGAVLFVAVPVADTTVAIVRRHRAGRPLLEGDRGHVYDQLVDRGWPPTAATAGLVAAQAALVGVGIALSGVEPVVAVVTVTGVVAVVAITVLAVFTSPRSWSR